MAPILALMYPTAGLIVAAAVALVFALTGLLPHSVQPWMILFMIVAAVLALVVALKVEHLVSRFKPYRIVRHVFRLIAVGTITFGAIIGVRPNKNCDRALNQASGGAVFAGLTVIVMMHLLFPMLDRAFFPVMDDHAKIQAINYAGMSEEEILARKNAKFHGILRFAGAWLIGTIVLMVLLPKFSVFLLALGWCFVCWVLQDRLFFKKPRMVVSPAGGA